MDSTLTGVKLHHRPVPAQLADRMSCHNPQGTRRGDRWFAVWSIALGSFALVFSELIPVGLLPHLSRAFGVSIGVAGLMVVIPAVAAAVAAPILTLSSARIERRVLLWTLSVLVLASDVVAAAAPNFAIMLVARTLLGVCIGGFWVFGAGAAMSLVRAEARGTAIALVSGGIFVATVAALPTAALIGNLTSWRVAFVIAAGLAVAAIVLQAAALPCLGTGVPVHPRTLLTILKVSAARIGLVAAAAIFFADFASYTYLNPLLQSRAGLTGEQVTVVLLGFGLAGGATNFAAGVTVRRHLRATLFGAGLLIAIAALLIAVISGVRPVTIALVLLWGAGFGAVPVAAQTWMAQTMPANIEGGLALFVSALQGSLAAGSAVGGVLFNAYGTTGPLVLTAVVAACGSLVLVSRTARAVDASASSEVADQK